MVIKFSETSLIDHNLIDNQLCCPLTREQIKQILDNQNTIERLKDGYKNLNDKHFIELCEAYLG